MMFISEAYGIVNVCTVIGLLYKYSRDFSNGVFSFEAWDVFIVFIGFTNEMVNWDGDGSSHS